MFGIARISTRLLWANPGRLIVLVAGSVSVALAASAILLAASTSLAVVQQTVDAGWRGTYDLLVRPADAPSLSVGGHDVVPLDYLGIRTSGITRQQWQRIAQLPNVEVAAPVAALGWMKNATPGITAVLAHHDPAVVYEVEARGTIAGQIAIRRTGLIAFLDDRKEVDVGFTDYAGPDPVYVSFRDLPAAWGLVVGIDPASEDALMGLSRYVDGTYLSSGTSEVFDPGFGRTAVALPLLTSARSPIPGDLSVTISTLKGVTAEQVEAIYRSRQPETRDGLESVIQQLVATGSRQRISGASRQLRDLVPPLRWGGITLVNDGDLRFTEGESAGGGLLTDDNIVLAPSLAGYVPSTGDGNDLALSSLGSWQDVIDPQLAKARPNGWWPPEATFGGDASVYRDLSVTTPPPFLLTPVGTYDREAIATKYASAANDAPLGIYADIARTLLTDADGKPVNQPLPVSINPAGLNPQPPVGLTNLEAVEALRGGHFIDAVRVRVAGISGYSPDAVRRIETVAQQIVESTGLHVDVVAGSSPIDLRVAVPGVGTMSERWTTLGTAAEIVSGTTGLSAVLLAAALIVVLAYLVAFGLFLTGDQAAEIRTLGWLGWRRRSLVGLVGIQALALGLLAAALTAGLVAGLTAAAQLDVSGWALAGAALVVLVAHPLAAGLTGFARLGQRRTRTSARSGGRTLGGVPGLALTFAREAPSRTLVAGAATALALAVAGVVSAIEIAAGGELRATLFGAVVQVRLAPYHLLAAAAALFAAGALILDGALLTVERRLALIGTLRAVGWRSGAIRRLVTLETGLPALVAGLLAALVVGLVAWWLGLGWLALALAAGVLALAAMLAVVATQLPVGVAVRTAPAATLRAEGASGLVGGFAPRQAILTVAALVVTVSLVASGWAAAESAATAPLPFVTPTEHPLSDTAKRIEAEVATIATDPDRTAGSPGFEQALGQVSDALTAAGFRVQTSAYLSRQPIFLDASGSSVEQDSLTVSLAYDAAAWDGRDLEGPATLLDATQGRLPATCPAGIGVLRVDGHALVIAAAQLQQHCAGRTAALLSVQLSDDAWTTFSAAVASVRLPVAHFLAASSPAATATPAAPWLVVTLDSSGPGASQSAAPAAVMLEVARLAAAAHLPLRVAIASERDGASGSALMEQVAAAPAGPMLWLGPMGGIVAPVLGTAKLTDVDPIASTAGLILIAPVDARFDHWLARANAPSDQATGDTLLEVLTDATGIAAGEEASANTAALAAGLDAAYLGEPAIVTVGPPSQAGTPADTVAQIHATDLEQLAAGILAAVKKLTQ